MSFITENFKNNPYKSLDIKVNKEDKLYRTALAYNIKDVIESYNFFVKNNLRGILCGKHQTIDGDIIFVKDVEVRFPQFVSEEGNFLLTPFLSRQLGCSYMCDVYIIYKETKYFQTNNQTNAVLIDDKLKSKKIGFFHCLTGSFLDITTIKPQDFNGSNDEWKSFLSECPSSPNAYTINNGNEKIIAIDQKLRTNIKVTFLTKDKLIESRITCMNNSKTTVVRVQIGKNLPNVKILFPHLKGKHYPLYLVFYLIYYTYLNNSNESIDFSIGKFALIIASFAPKEEHERIIAYLKSSRIKFESLFITEINSKLTIDIDKIREYIFNKLLKPKSINSEVDTKRFILETISQNVYNELYIQCKTYKEKIANLCELTCQTVRVAIGTRDFDSRDKLSNQKGDSLVRMLAIYTTDTLLEMIKTKSVDTKGFNYGKSDRKDVIVEERKTETLNASIAETCKIVNRVDPRTNSISLREVSEDTLPNICPAKTPEGITCGLNKQKSALSHFSDNQEYNINRKLPIDDLFEPYIQYISNIKTNIFKYQICFINPNGQNFPTYYGLTRENINDQIFYSSRILYILDIMFNENKLIYYIDDDSIIYVRFYLQCFNYSFETYMGGILYVSIPTEMEKYFSNICSKIRNPDYKISSSIIPHIDCQMNLGFRTFDNPEIFTVTVVNTNGENTLLNISDFFIDMLKIIIYKNDKLDIFKSEKTGIFTCVITSKSIIYHDYLHHSGLQIACYVPSYMKNNFSILLGIINEYISTEKSKKYSSSFNFNGNVIVANDNGFYPRILWVNHKKIVEYIRGKRRNGFLPYDTFASFDEKDMSVGFFDDSGRLSSIMLIVDEDGDLVIDKLNSWERFNNVDYDNSKNLIKSLYSEGSIELIDSREMDSVLLPIDIEECRNISKLRKFLNVLDIDNLKSSIFETLDANNNPTGYYRNEDIMSIKVHGNSYDIEFSLIKNEEETLTFQQDNLIYYGNYIINRNVYYPTSKRIFKLIPPEDSILRDGYHILIFKDSKFEFITKSMDPETDDINVYLQDLDGNNIKYEMYYIDFSKSKELYVDINCTIVEVKKLTRDKDSPSTIFIVEGEVINEDDLIDNYFYNKNGNFIVPDEYNFSYDEYEAIFDLKIEKIRIPISNDLKDYPQYNTIIENSIELDEREAKLYISTIRRYIEDLNCIPDSYTEEDHYKIISLLKVNITEFAVKKYINIIRRYLNTEFKFTHCLIDPNQAYSFIANFVPKADSNPGPRFSYQCSMGVQAMGNGNSIRFRRFETSIKSLISPTEHPFETVAELPLNQTMLPVTQNFVFLVASDLKGFEDAIIVSKSALEKFGRYEKELCIKIAENSNNEITERITFPMRSNENLKSGHVYRNLDKNGIPILGSRILVGDCIIGRTKEYNNTSEGYKKVDSSFFAGIGTEGIVTAVHIIGSENIGVNAGFRTIIIKIAQRRTQQIGDKMAARYSQKGTISAIINGMINDGDKRLKIVDDFLMAYVAAGPNKGLRAEIIFNPASFPSRMTCGLIKEILPSKSSLYLQEKIDASSFHKLNLDYYKNALWKNKLISNNDHLDINGNEILCHYDGELIMDSSTNKPMKFFMGIVAYQFLKHHVVDKETSRAKGSVKQITHQPTEGRHIGGGQRFGTMEQDVMLSYGSSYTLFDRFMKASDAYTTIYCTFCKQDSSISNLKSKICNLCGNVASLCTVDEPRIYKVFKHQMASIGLNILQTLKPIDDFQEDLVKNIKSEFECEEF